MNDRDRVFQIMDTIRSVLERLPEAAVQNLMVDTYGKVPSIHFFRGTFDSALSAFPFARPIRKPHGDDGKYDMRQFFVDDVMLFELIETETREEIQDEHEGSEEQKCGAPAPAGPGPDSEVPEEAGVGE